jgi:hypothetical protein
MGWNPAEEWYTLSAWWVVGDEAYAIAGVSLVFGDPLVFQVTPSTFSLST